MDLSLTTAPDSTQVNAEDFLAGPRTVTITGVRKGTDEQPVNIDLAEYPGRAYRPGKSMRRVLVAAWGPDSSTYIGRRLTLFCDPNISFGRERTGGIRISHLSDIAKPMTLALTVSRGKRAPFVVKPLAETEPTKPTADSITPQQLKQLADGLTALGITDRAAMLATVAQVIDREIESSRELTGKEAAAVLDWITHEEQADTEPQLPDGGDQ